MASKNNRPHWRLPRHRYPKTGAERLANFGDKRQVTGSAEAMGVPRCVAIARTTGERCKGPALQGADRCRMHGGHKKAYAAASKAKPGKPLWRSSGLRMGSAALALIGMRGAPEGFTAPVSGGPRRRGRAFERYRNAREGFRETEDEPGDT